MKNVTGSRFRNYFLKRNWSKKTASDSEERASPRLYSQAQSHYYISRELLPAPFPTWAGSLLLRRPGTGPKRLRPTVKNGHLPGSIHRRNPTTTSRGNFCLLRFRPGPVRSSLDDLVRRSSLRPTISTRCIARTPVRHTATGDRTPNSMPSNSLDFQSSWITRPRHRSQSIRFFLLRYLTILT
ncbi:uncharacterized protein TNCV_4903401 [Trichonephila clavipes]|uniref:Uncharacterized protein n=1 Tax=Trichonephila clavipes TaxID=2585209 RepID=A0A8X6S7F0_TRICX|nr:uncharacterized protein TNCV_4903381 [Trichonephila clavipes]GFY07097.1 uncharacterized protein TNCV_4903391 [Trichonephila clavipes]GFY07098.1 uncharacterized protein TNCV_4903401 [Trichonephila clavipes]